jgi:hypothetical protein
LKTKSIGAFQVELKNGQFFLFGSANLGVLSIPKTQFATAIYKIFTRDVGYRAGGKDCVICDIFCIDNEYLNYYVLKENLMECIRIYQAVPR